MNGNLKKAVWTGALAALVLASSSFAGYGFSDYRDRDQSRFVMKPAKPFRPDKEVVTVVMREASPTYSDLWYGDLVAVNTDVYAGEKWKNRDAGLWFTTSDSIDGGESRIIWPVLPGTAYDAASLDPVIEYCYGLCGEFQLSGPALPYDPFVAIGFHLVGLDSNGKDIAVDVSNWEGICIQYTADVIPMLLLDLGDSVNKTLNGDLPRVRLPKSISGADRCYLWSDFEQEGWGRGDHITGEQAATQLVKIIFKIQSIDRSKGYFSIISLGTVKGNK